MAGGYELAAAAAQGQVLARALRGVLTVYQERLPVNAMIGSAALVSGLLAAVGFGAKYALARDLSNAQRDCDNLLAELRADEDAALKLGEDAPVTDAFGGLVYGHLAQLAPLQSYVAELGGRVEQFAGAAELAELPAQGLVSGAERVTDAAGNLVEQVSWWAKYGTTVIVVVVLAIVALLFFSSTGKALVGRVTGGSK